MASPCWACLDAGREIGPQALVVERLGDAGEQVAAGRGPGRVAPLLFIGVMFAWATSASTVARGLVIDLQAVLVAQSAANWSKALSKPLSWSPNEVR